VGIGLATIVGTPIQDLSLATCVAALHALVAISA